MRTRRTEEGFRREAWESRLWTSVYRGLIRTETLERADYIWPRRWQSQGGCWDKGHSGSGSRSQVHTLKLKLEAPSPRPKTRAWRRRQGERCGKEAEWKKDTNSKCFSALAAEHAWKSRGWIFHTFEDLPAPAKYDHFSLKCPPQQQQIPLTPGWVWGASSLRTRVPDWTRDKLQPRRDKAQAPPEPELGVGCWARVEALCGRAKEIGERQVQKRSWA